MSLASNPPSSGGGASSASASRTQSLKRSVHLALEGGYLVYLYSLLPCLGLGSGSFSGCPFNSASGCLLFVHYFASSASTSSPRLRCLPRTSSQRGPLACQHVSFSSRILYACVPRMLSLWSFTNIPSEPVDRSISQNIGYQSKVRVIDRYKVIGFISSGTYGRVYKAVGRSGQTGEFAIKKFKPGKRPPELP
jgi:hypothetical protein